METQDTVEGVIDLFEEGPRASGSGLLNAFVNTHWADSTGKVVMIEATHNCIEVFRGDHGIDGVANHHQFVNRKIAGGSDPELYVPSFIRVSRMWELVRKNWGNIDLDKAMEFTRDHGNGIKIGDTYLGSYNTICKHPTNQIISLCSGRNAFVDDMFMPVKTLTAYVFEPMNRVIWISQGNPCRVPYYRYAPFDGSLGPLDVKYPPDHGYKYLGEIANVKFMVDLFRSSILCIRNRRMIQNGPPLIGDWIITEDASVRGETIDMRGDIIVKSGATLNLHNVKLIMHSFTVGLKFGSYRIVVEKGATINIDDGSEITAALPPIFYGFVVKGDLCLRDSTIKEAYSLDIETEDGSIIIENSSFEGNEHTGIFFNNATGKMVVLNCRFIDNFLSGIYIKDSSPVITGNYFARNYFGIHVMYNSTPLIRNNVITSNKLDGIKIYYANPIVEGNELTNNVNGIDVRSSEPVIINNTISKNQWTGIWNYDSNSIIKENEISGNSMDGIYRQRSSPEISGNIISNNKCGIYAFHKSYPDVEKNEFYENKNDVYSVENSPPLNFSPSSIDLAF